MILYVGIDVIGKQVLYSQEYLDSCRRPMKITALNDLVEKNQRYIHLIGRLKITLKNKQPYEQT